MDRKVRGIGGFILRAPIIRARIPVVGSSVVGSGASTGGKVVWILVLPFLPLLGFLAWPFLGPRPVR